MSIAKWSLIAALLAWCAVPAMAESPIQTAFNYDLVSNETDTDGEAAASPADDAACDCDQAECTSCCCDPCSCGLGSGLLGCCCLGDPWTLKECLTPCSEINYGGWVQAGYHSDYTRLSAEDVQGLSFNDHPDHLNLHQLWFFVEKEAEADGCCADWGFRFDMLYGLDAQKTQAFGNDDNIWDVSLDHGVYGWAMPQLYGEVAYGDWVVKVGHFFTLVGYEVVPATGNFFYSHSLTFFNSEPFTHTGVLAEYKLNDCLTLHGGWVLGWDSGFDQFDDANALHAGAIAKLTDDVSYSYMCTAGDLGWRGDGYSHSNVFTVDLSECLTYVLQSDYVRTEFPDGLENQDVGINQYMFYKLNDCLSLGTRVEWWKSNNANNTGIGECASFQEITGGINYKPHANVVIRPEIRYDWTSSNVAFADSNDGVDYNQTVFGIDAIVTY